MISRHTGGCADNPTERVGDRRDSQLDIDESPVLADPDGFILAVPGAFADGLHNVPGGFPAFWTNELQQGLPDNLVRRITHQFLRGLVPSDDDPIRVPAPDGVPRSLQYRLEPHAISFQLRATVLGFPQGLLAIDEGAVLLLKRRSCKRTT